MSPQSTTKDRQRGRVELRKARIALMPKIPCECGCGTLIAPLDANLQPLRYIKGHQTRVNPSPHTGKPAYNRGDATPTNAERSRRYRAQRYAAIDLMPKIPCACGCGTLIAPIGKRLKPVAYAYTHQRVGKKYPK